MKEYGFTLIEAIISLCLSSIVLAGLSYAFVKLQYSEKDGIQQHYETVDNSNMGTKFIELIERSGPSLHFIHLPVPVTGCLPKGPCIRELDLASKDFVSLRTSLLTKFEGKPFEFYRDHIALLKRDIPLNMGGDDDITITNTLATDLISKLPLEPELYATWPLADETSQPFPLLTSLNIPFLFQFEEVSGTSAPPVGASYLITKIQGPVVGSGDIGKLNSNLVVIYNAYDSRSYTVQVISEIRLCRDDLDFCQEEFNKNGLSILPTAQHALIRLSPVSDSSIDGMVPAITGEDSSWPGQLVNQLFPAKANVSLLGDADLGESVEFDLRKWSHFNHAQQVSSNLILMPVSFHSYRIKNVQIRGEVRHQLVRQVYGNGGVAREFVEIDDVKGPVIFARQLGSTSFRAFMYR